jgi:protein involved in polysaccharide export with SLBB domain
VNPAVILCLAAVAASPATPARVLARQLEGAKPASNDVYVVQVGDELSLKVFGRPELDDTVTVRPDGRISALLINDIEASGLTTVRLHDALTERYAKFFLDPVVTVIVRRIANLKVFVGGEVGQPGMVAISGELSAIGAVAQAGGFKGTAKTGSVILLRKNALEKPTAVRLDLHRLESDDAAMKLQPHDVIWVPASNIAKVDKFVDQYMRQLLPISLTAGFTYLTGANAVAIK